MLAYFKAIGKYITDCGLTDVAVESGIIAGGSVNSFLIGKHFNRCKRIHPMMALGLECLMFEAFVKHEAINNCDENTCLFIFIFIFIDNDCSKRWGYVRDYYIKRRGKPSTGSSGEAAKKRSEQLSFLDSISSGKRSTLSNIENSESQESVKNSTALCSKESNNIEQQQSELLTVDDTSSNILDIPENGAETEKTPKVTKRKCSTTYTPADERLKILRQIAERQDQNKMEKQDENDLFFASIAKITSKLPKIVQARLRMQIGNLVGNAEIEHLSPLPSADYGRGPLSAGSSTSYSTFVSDDSVTPIGASAYWRSPANTKCTCFDKFTIL
ncbi:uncharacterized protein LOC126740673 [Anthonomus grandis grandis]|uniref:uncharacterized protein LOC126740673 n=1 Tax=Anthonomus grandis grandis TaxID=2921223 RepID=UPI0021668EC8|nr:uncharacterized protein LOC126740673 [Anthonomus grandis grandis]